MPVLIDYILKLNICLVVVYLFYQILLRRLTFYNWNRWYLFGYTVLSFIIPLIDIMPSLQKRDLQHNAVMQWIPVISFQPSEEQSFFETLSYWDWAIAVLVLGALLLLTRLLLGYYSLRKLKRKGELISSDDTKIYQLDEPITPFSFGNAIFINTEMHDGEDLEEIIRHEFVHVKQKHTMDIVWCEILCMLNWFNPVVWALKRDVKQNLEFIADSKVLQSGMDKTEYQYLLLKVMGNKQFAFTNHFNFSSLKKRIAMMNAIKSAKVNLIKFMFLLPVVAVLLLSFRKEIKERQKEQAMVQQSVARDEKMATDVDLPKVVVALPVAKIMRDTVPAKPALPAITLRSAVDLSDPDKKPLIVVDGKTMEKGYDLNAIQPADIQSVTVLKNVSAIALYGEDAINGVIQINTKAGGEANTTKIRDASTGTGKKPLFVIDGKTLVEGDLESVVSPDKIESVTVWKNGKAVEMYGERAKDGVVFVTTRKKVAETRDAFNKAYPGTVNYQDNKTQYQLKADRIAVSPDAKTVTVSGNVSGTLSPVKISPDHIVTRTTAKAGGVEEVMVVDYGSGKAESPTLKGKVAGLQVRPSANKSGPGEVVVTGYTTSVAQAIPDYKTHIVGKYNGVGVAGSNVLETRTAGNAKGSLQQLPEGAYYVLDGAHVSHKKIKGLKGEDIESIDVLKGDHATKFYGKKASEGAIIITTK